MTEPTPNVSQFKSAALVWVLNVVLIGLGNLYASGNKKQCWYLIGFAVVANWFWHWWWSWPLLYLIASFVGHGAVDSHNETVRLVNEDKFSRQRRTASGNYGDSRLSSSGPAPQITDDFQRKLKEAEQEIRRRNVQESGKLNETDYDEQVKRWLKPQSEANRRAESQAKVQKQAKDNAEERDRKSSSESKRRIERKQERVAGQERQSGGKREAVGTSSNQGGLAVFPADLDGKVVDLVQNAIQTVEPTKNWADSGGFPEGLGLTSYEPFVTKDQTLASTGSALADSQMDAAFRKPDSDITGSGVARSLSPAALNVLSEAPSDVICKRCGTKCDHDFSFCLNCGHSYALS